MIDTLVYEDKVIDEVYVADSFIKRFLGYMFQRKPNRQAIVFIRCNSIHTFFMRFNIDVIFINDYMEVVKVVKCVRPWKVIMPVKGATAVIEVPSTK
jgi:uncharacterized membrane protein (UPF0127 family)